MSGNTKPRKLNLSPLEHIEQALLFQWAEIAKARHPDLEWLYAIPNFSGRLGKIPPKAALIQAAKLNREGRKKGYPDVGLDVARKQYHGLRIELKRQQGGTSKPDQKRWHERLRAQDYCVVVCLGWEAARDVIVNYLSLDPSPPLSR